MDKTVEMSNKTGFSLERISAIMAPAQTRYIHTTSTTTKDNNRFGFVTPVCGSFEQLMHEGCGKMGSLLKKGREMVQIHK